MKIIHICGPSGVGKNFLLKKLERTVKKDTDALQESEKRILNRFDATGRCEFPGPVSTGHNRELSHLIDDLERFAKDGNCDTIFHRWQIASSEAIKLAGEILPDYEQKTFILWLDPPRHINQGLIYRHDSSKPKRWSYNKLLTAFHDCIKQVLFNVKQSYGHKDEDNYEQIDLAHIPSQLEKFNIEVVTSISRHLYATIDAETLKTILERKPEPKS